MYRAPTGGVAGAAGAAGELAMTGSDLGWWIALGVVLVISGLLLLRSGRRHRRTD